MIKETKKNNPSSMRAIKFANAIFILGILYSLLIIFYTTYSFFNLNNRSIEYYLLIFFIAFITNLLFLVTYQR